MDNKVRVLIVGAGLGGLVLAILLEKAGIPYMVFERAVKVRPLGSALQLNCNILPLFEQLGLYDQIRAMSKQRLELYELLLTLVPNNKILTNRKVLSIKQDEATVVIQFSDNSGVQGDVLVGADGVYSAVRQSLFRQLQQKGELPEYNVNASRQLGKALMGQTFFEEFFRRVMLNYIPKFVVRKMFDHNHAYRPQSSFLPQAPTRRIVKVLPQTPSRREPGSSSSSLLSTHGASSASNKGDQYRRRN